MKKINLLIIMVVTVFVMFSCQKEEPLLELQAESVEYLKTESIDKDRSVSKIDQLSLSLQEVVYERKHYLIDAVLGRNGENYMPSFEIQQKLLALMLEQDAENAFLDAFLDTYGLPVWEESFLNQVSDEQVNVMAVPFLKNGQITGVLQFYDLAESSRIFFVSKVTIEQVVNDKNYEGDLSSMKTAILNMLIFESNIHGAITNDYVNWLRLNLSEDTTSGRTSLWCVESEDTWIQTVTSGGALIGITVFTTVTTECYLIGFPGQGSGNWNGGGSISPEGEGQDGGISGSSNEGPADPDDSSGFFDRTLECQSFNFVPQVNADGQIACVDNLYLSKDFGGVHSNTDFFCGHFTLPRIRFDGQVISSGQAADCAAWAANAAAVVVGFAFAESPDYSMTDEAMIRLFKETFKIKMALTDCGYGVMADCHNGDCLANPTSASWNEGFFEWLDEQLFGCE